jgi:hypothetical protein
MSSFGADLKYLRHAFLHKSTTAAMDVQIDIAQWHPKHMKWIAALIADAAVEVRPRCGGRACYNFPDRPDGLHHYPEGLR